MARMFCLWMGSAALATLLATTGGCQTEHKVEVVHRIPDPITVNMNVKIDMRVQREVNNLIDDIYGAPASQPAAK